MAADTCGMCLLGAMDNLWFHQIILFSGQYSFFNFPETSKTALPTSELLVCSSKSTSKMSVISDQEISPAPNSVETSSQESDDHVKETTTREERPTRLNLVSRKTRSHSSSPISAKKQSRNLGCAGYSARRLQKTMRSKSLGELELEEVKGFMDLGFVFKKENLSRSMINLIPGLQRIDAYKTEEKDSRDSFAFTNNTHENVEDEEDEDEERKGIMRPYLSEAWLIKRPDSPLLSLRIPRVCTTEDMKKQLKCWARTVASAIQESG